MKTKFNIAFKIILFFAVIVIAVVANTLLTNNTLNKSKKTNDMVTKIYGPSAEYLDKLDEMISNTAILSKSWVYIDKKENTPNKQKLKDIIETNFYKLDTSILEVYDYWNEEAQEQYIDVSRTITDTLFVYCKEMMDLLSGFESYNDFLTTMEAEDMVNDDDGKIILMCNKISSQLEALKEKQQNIVDQGRVNMDKSFDMLGKIIQLMGVLLFILSIGAGIFIINSLVRPVNYISEILLKIAKGVLPDKEIKTGKDEIGQMLGALSRVVTGLRNTSNFSQEVGKGNYDSEFEALSDQDVLGNSLIEMRNELKKASKEEVKRRIEDEQRNWATQGIAKFSEILRENNDNIELLSFNIISELVKYTGSNQGGIFLINDSDKENIFVEMKASYAFDRKKFKEKKIPVGVGLIGRCVQEKETIFMTDIPNDYINITSGLGKDNPRSLIIIPLVLNEEIFGVIEMASFKVYEAYQIDFLERIGETIASTVSAVKINMQTAVLLEQSQEQAEEMLSQEEEMRQNMEELRATQEESERRETELKKELDELKAKMGKSE